MPDLRPDPQERDIKQDAALEGANQTPEEVSNQARGYKANLSNPSSSTPSCRISAIILTCDHRHQRGVKGKLEGGSQGLGGREGILQQGLEVN